MDPMDSLADRCRRGTNALDAFDGSGRVLDGSSLKRSRSHRARFHWITFDDKQLLAVNVSYCQRLAVEEHIEYPNLQTH